MAAPEPQATSAVAYTPVLTDLMRLIRAPFAPRGVFEEQRDKPTFWMPWLVLSVLFAVVAFVALPLTLHVARLGAESAGRPFPPAAESITRVAALAGTPIFLLIGLVIGAILLYLVLMVTGAEARFKGLMTVSVFVAPITLFQTLVTTIALRMRGLENIQTMADAKLTFGLDNLVSPEFEAAHKVVAALLRGIGPFEIWGLVVTAIGLAALEKVVPKKAWTASVVAFVLGLLIRAGFAMLSKTG
jgi:hypothetical protein